MSMAVSQLVISRYSANVENLAVLRLTLSQLGAKGQEVLPFLSRWPRSAQPAQRSKALFILLAGLSCFGLSLKSQSMYTAVDLGPYGCPIDGALQCSFGINSTGQIAGGASDYFVSGSIGVLGTLGGAGITSIGGLNNGAQVVGAAYIASNLATHAFLSTAGTMTDLRTVGGTNSRAYGVNNSAQVVGSSDTATSGVSHAFSYSGVITDLGTLSGGANSTLNSTAYGVNDNGQIVGMSYKQLSNGGLPFHAFLYSGSAMTDLGGFLLDTLNPGDYFSIAYAINNNGQITGLSFTGSETYVAVLFSGGGVQRLGDFGGGAGAGYSINNNGQVVGYSETSTFESHAFLYDGGAMSDLNNLVTLASGAYLTVAHAINDAGQIVATGSDGHLYLLTTTCPTQMNVRPSVGNVLGIQYMQAMFTVPIPFTVLGYAQFCGFASFNWEQQITVDPGTEKATLPHSIVPSSPSNLPNNVYPTSCSSLASASWPGTTCALVAGPSSATGLGNNYPPYFDPPLGGYTYFLPGNNPLFPFYYSSSAVTSPGTCTVADPSNPTSLIGFCPPVGTFPFVVSPGNTVLSFLDAPAHHGLPTPAAPPGTSPPPGTFVAFSTSLVGVDNQSNPHTLFSWTWNSTFNGTAGGISQTIGIYPIDPGSGTGGATITGVNGIQLPTLIPGSQVATTASGLAYSRVSQTFNGTVTITNISSTAINGPFQIVFFGMPATVTLVNATGNLTGTPYLTVPSVTGLAPGQSVTASVQFKNPSNVTISSTPVIYSGSIN